MANVEVRWTSTFDLDGRPPKGYITIRPDGEIVGDRLPIINGAFNATVPSGVYTITEDIPGHVRSYSIDIPASAAALGVDLDQYATPAPGTNITIISRDEFNTLVDQVEGLALTTRPFEPVYVRSVAAATWTVNHSLGRYPEVTVLDDLGRVVWADLSFPSTSQVIIEFATPQTGKAVLT